MARLVELVRPEGFEELLERPKPFEVGAIEPLFTVASDRDESGLAEEREMLRHTRVAQVESLDEFTNREFVTPDVPQNLLAARLGDKLEGVHAVILLMTEMYVTFLSSLK